MNWLKRIIGRENWKREERKVKRRLKITRKGKTSDLKEWERVREKDSNEYKN